MNGNDKAKKLYEIFTSKEYYGDPYGSLYRTDDKGEGMALVSQVIRQYWKPRIILDHNTKCAYEFMDESQTLVTVKESDINWESLERLPYSAISCAKHLDFHYPSSVYYFRNGVAQIEWRVNPDGRYFMDDHGFGMTTDDEINIYGFIDRKGEVVLKFQAVENEDELKQMRVMAEENLLARQ